MRGGRDCCLAAVFLLVMWCYLQVVIAHTSSAVAEMLWCAGHSPGDVRNGCFASHDPF